MNKNYMRGRQSDEEIRKQELERTEPIQGSRPVHPLETPTADRPYEWKEPDTVDPQKLMNLLRERITDSGLLELILKYLKAGAITREGNYEKQLKGVPQGGPLSPLLANVLLNELDTELEERGHTVDSASSSGGLTLRAAFGCLSPLPPVAAAVRYADDFVILCGSRRAGERILPSVCLEEQGCQVWKNSGSPSVILTDPKRSQGNMWRIGTAVLQPSAARRRAEGRPEG